MLSSTSLKLLSPVREILGLEELTLGRDYWVLGAMGLGLKNPSYSNYSGNQIDLRLIVCSSQIDLTATLAKYQIESRPFVSSFDDSTGFEFSFKDFLIRVSQDSRAPEDNPELRLFMAMQTLLRVHGQELIMVLERYLSYGLNLERGFIEYFGWGSEWRERLIALPNPSSHEAIVRFSC